MPIGENSRCVDGKVVAELVVDADPNMASMHLDELRIHITWTNGDVSMSKKHIHYVFIFLAQFS